MNNLFRRIALLPLFVAAFCYAADRQVLDQVRSVLLEHSPGGLEELRQSLMGLDANARALYAEEAIRVFNQSAQKEGEGGRRDIVDMLKVFPEVADGLQLRVTLPSLLAHPSDEIRESAFEALSRARGAQAEELLVIEGDRALKRLPNVPVGTVDEVTARKQNIDGIAFIYCLLGLFKSESPDSRAFGEKYLNSFRERYAGSLDGQKVVEAVEQELKRRGVSTAHISVPVAAPNEEGQPFAAPVREPAHRSAKPVTPIVHAPTAAVDVRIPIWRWFAGVIVVIAIVVVALKRLGK